MSEDNKKVIGSLDSQMEPTANNTTNKPLTLKELNKIYGSSGTSITHGLINDDYNRDMTGRNAAKIYDEMRRSDATVSAAILACKLPILATERYIDPAKDKDGTTDEASREVADRVHEQLFIHINDGRETLMNEVLTFFIFGFSLFEKVYTVRDGKIVVEKLALRKQSTIQQWETQDGEPGVLQQLPSVSTHGVSEGKYQTSIPANKLLRFTINQEGDNYDGISLLRPAYKHRYYKTNLEKFDAMRHEKQGVGVPVTHMPAGASDDDKEYIAEVVKNFKTNEQSGIVFPGPKEDGWNIEFLDLRAGDGTQILTSIEYHDRQITKSVLAQFLELGVSSGSRALSEDHSSLFLTAIEYFAKLLANIFNRYLIKELVDLNYDVEHYPQLTFKKISRRQYDTMANAVKTLVDAGALDVSGDADVDIAIRELLDLPPPSKQKQNQTKEEQQPKEKTDPPATAEFNDHERTSACHHSDIPPGETCFDDKYFSEMIGLYNNNLILQMHTEAASDEDRDALKKKGLRFNSFEENAFRPLTFSERKVDWNKLKKGTMKFNDNIEKATQKALKSMSKEIVEQVVDAIRNDDIGSLATIRADGGAAISRAMSEQQINAFELGKQTAAKEMGVSIPKTAPQVKSVMSVQNAAVVEKIQADMVSNAQTTASNIIARHGGEITETNIGEVRQAVRKSLDPFVNKAANSVSTLSVQVSLNMGRATIYETHPEMIYGFQYSAILDERTTTRCLSLDGRVVAPGSAEFYDYSPPQHRGCRSIRVEILMDETFKPPITGIPDSIDPILSLDNVPKIEKPVLYKGSPAIGTIKKEIRERETKLAELQRSGKYENQQKNHIEKIKQLEESITGLFSEMGKEIMKAQGITFNR